MNKLIYSAMLVWLMTLGVISNTNAQICRPAIDCKFGTPDAIGWAMQNFFNDGSTASWNFQPGAVFQENVDGTATLTGTVTQYGTGVAGIPARSFTVSVNFTGKSSTTTGTPETSNGCPPPSTSGWFYYTLSSGTLTGVSGTAAAGAQLSLSQHMMPAQYGIGAANQCLETSNLGLTSWFEWTVRSQPSNGWLSIMPYPAYPVIGQADICINIHGTPYNCGPNPPPCRPAIVCPPNMTKTPTNNLTCWTNFIWTTPVATTSDPSCSIPTVTQIAGPTSGSCIGYGVSTITYKATDNKGNMATCSFTITVVPPNNPCDNDVTPPTIVCPPNLTKTAVDNAQHCWTSFTWSAATATDNCCIPTVTQIAGPTSGSCIGYGTSTVTYKATDKKGNMATCSFTIIVTPPVCNPTFDPSKCYKIVPRNNRYMCLGFDDYNQNWNGAQVGAYYYNGYCCQQWKYESLGNGSCRWRNAYFNKYLGAQRQNWYGWTWDNDRVCQYDNNYNVERDWTIICNADGSYSFKHNASTLMCSFGYYNNCSLSTYNQEFDIVEVPCGCGQYAQTAQVFVSDAQAEANRVRVDFATNRGAETDYFNVKKLNNTTGAFETLEIINNKISDNSLQAHSAYDNAPNEGDNYYQVEIALNNGSKTLSEIQKVNFTSIKGLVLFPNPASDFIDVNLKDYKGKDVTIYLYNQIGVAQIVRQVQNAGATLQHIELNDLSQGQYLLRVEAKGLRDAVKSVIIQK